MGSGFNFPQNLSIQPSKPPSHLFTLDEINEPLSQHTDGGNHINILQSIDQYGIAGRVWEAAYVFTSYICPPSHLQIEFNPSCPLLAKSGDRGRTVIELGSGTGYVGLQLAKYLDSQSDIVILTDLTDVCPLLEDNASRMLADLNQSPGAEVWVRPLAWGNSNDARNLASQLGLLHSASTPPRPPTHIVCSDLVYFTDLLAPLLRSLIYLTSPPFASPSSHPPVQVILSYKVRSLQKESPFWFAFGAWFSFHPVLYRHKKVPPSQWNRFGSSTSSFVFVATRKQETLGWTVPEDDTALMGRGDMAFEQILLFDMES
ncbi:hypothetical protein BOTBODRAFT_111314 [Botryobasidium botryosum FD-172 SS1]|uniref:Protein-lysine N-methyltransferase EFM6 n=1 Tax=Botryobasidium botryosum (strain FD-172 SS1) TaxID=930990 RepID=A0A067MPN2_BOTB1|nr:hypothetical protein BOTBODRAFT_111314 [Botryobasidium botryosum FD-172 SS1]